jgi:hypothetical protein
MTAARCWWLRTHLSDFAWLVVMWAYSGCCSRFRATFLSKIDGKSAQKRMARPESRIAPRRRDGWRAGGEMGHRSGGDRRGCGCRPERDGVGGTGWAERDGVARNGDWSVGPDRRFQALPYQPLLHPAYRDAPTTRTFRHAEGVVTIDDVRAVASDLPRSYEVIVADRVKFRVGRIVFLAFSRDEKTMGFGFPKEERELLVSSEPHKFQMPSASDMRYNWAHVRLEAIDHDEMRELVLDAWQMVVPKKVAAEYLERRPGTGPP